MKILGINYLSESSVTLLENGKIIYSLSEERINRVKNWWGNPYKSVNYMLRDLNLKLEDIDIITTHGLIGSEQKVPIIGFFKQKEKEILNSKLSTRQKKNTN